ncbi:hypothetical protein WR25_10326 [Diploscapter pachys]|uniref:Uncharacterized protein n=1 Tax=Diploscapter pachys TaxID=2018661 RepID=A0A2A2KF72_9BILA|nr:hypothetical protein WR25_10326 [Diploscapter pachys]
MAAAAIKEGAEGIRRHSVRPVRPNDETGAAGQGEQAAAMIAALVRQGAGKHATQRPAAQPHVVGQLAVELHLRLTVGSAQGHPQTGTAGGYGGRANRCDQQAAFAQQAGQCQRPPRIADKDRLDCSVLAAGNEGAGGTTGLAQRADQHRHIIDTQTEMLDQAAAVDAQGTKAMGIVDHQPSVAAAGGIGQGRKVGAIAIHTEHAVGNHQGIAGSFL